MAGDSSKKKLLDGAFSKDSLLFAHIGQNDKASVSISIIEVKMSPQTFAEIKIENGPATSLSFAKVSMNSDASSDSKKRKRATPSVVDCLFIGLADGSIICAAKNGQILAKSPSAHKSQVNDLCFDEDHLVLYSAGQDGFLKQWSMENGKNSQIAFKNNHEWNINSDPIYRIMLQDSKNILVGQYKVFLWDLVSAKVVGEFNGHTTGVSKLKPLLPFGEQEIFATLGENDKTAQIWGLGQESPKFILSLPDEPALNISPCGNNRVVVQGTSKLYLFELAANGKKKVNTLKPFDSIKGKHDFLIFLESQLYFLSQKGKFENVLKEDETVVPIAVAENPENNPKENRARKNAKLTTGQALVVEPIDPSLVKEEPPVPSEQSLVTVLSQALTSMDKDLLEECLKVVDMTIIKNTILALEYKYLHNLLKYLKEKLILKPNRIKELKHWLAAILNLRTDRLKSSKECLEEVEEILQFSSMQAQLLPKLLEMRQVALVNAASNVDDKLKISATNVLLMYDEETGNNELVQKVKSNLRYATIPEAKAEEVSDEGELSFSEKEN
jgi:hypothetical protein